jgi:GT2 family glycosyltransferase
MSESPTPLQGSLPKLLSPSDWQRVGRQPEFYVTAESTLRIRLLELADFKRAGSDGAATVSAISLKPCKLPGILLGRPDRAVSEGDYIVRLEDAESGNTVSLSGCCVRSASDNLAHRFEAMLKEQAKYGKRLGLLPFSGRKRRGNRNPLFSIATTVYNTDPYFLEEIAQCILGQKCEDFEWLLLENGSTLESTRRACRSIGERDPRVRLFEVEENLHIIGGNRYLLERACGEYIVPVDSDDILYPHALRILQRYIRSNGNPDLLYSDEQKISMLGTPMELLWRPGWSRLFCMSTCPASHLMIFKRDLALKAGVYTEDYAKGSHDWDTALRLDDQGARVVQVPEVLYGWRMHPASAAMNEDSKNYLAKSQINVVRGALERKVCGTLFDVESAHDQLGYYHLARKQNSGPPVVVHCVIPASPRGNETAALAANLAATDYPGAFVRVYVHHPLLSDKELENITTRDWPNLSGVTTVPYRDEEHLLEQISRCRYLNVPVQAVLYNRLKIESPGWLWDAVGTFDLDSETGIVGGRLTNADGRTMHVGYVAALNGFLATPGYGGKANEIWGAIPNLRRHVTAVYGSFLVVRTDTLRQLGPLRGFDREDGLYGIEFCLRAARRGVKTAYAPRMRTSIDWDLLHPAGSSNVDLRAEIRRRYSDLLKQDPYYSRHCVQLAEAYGQTLEA